MTYRSQPQDTAGMPGGIPYIVANEAAERFSYYGMRTILIVFMTKYLLDSSGNLAPMGDDEAKGYYHLFSTAVYFFPFLGALLSDWLIGKYRTILYLSIVYCAGHIVLALDETRFGLALGLGLIAFGSGGIKPCVASHVGDQFGKRNQHLMEKVFSWFYFSINLGAFLSTAATPLFLAHYGPSVAFGVPGLLMILATFVFWLGRHKFIHVKPAGSAFIKEATQSSSLKTLGKLSIIYIFVAVFWALFEQTGSSWVLQADDLDRMVWGFEILPSQVQAANPFMILAFIPVASYLIYPALGKIMDLTPLKKISIGLFLTFLSFLIIAYCQTLIDQGESPTILWQVLAYAVITMGEVFVSITCLEFSYTQAPKSLKSIIMALFYFSVAIGNMFVSVVNFFIMNEDGSSKLAGADYYYFFAYVMGITAVLFLAVVKFYKPTPVAVASSSDIE
ncbi:MAG: POT family MFS transporter [Pseudobacteriovorax sp.]|nr:POT family MFS transporter [Pseudobacteriovorax sp.]